MADKVEKFLASMPDADKRRENFLADREAYHRFNGWASSHAKQMAMDDWHREAEPKGANND